MKRIITFKLFLSLFFVGLFGNAFAQITIDNTKTPDKLITDVLIPSASGTVVSNIQYKGIYSNSNKSQFGTFVSTGATRAAMTFSNGIILTSGYSSAIPGNSSTENSNFWSSCTQGEIRSSGTCPTVINDLRKMVGSGANYLQGAILEFDFIPVASSVQFKYIFGSEEYSDYNCSIYNDKFAFLLSGPGISGGQGFDNDAKNIARLSNGAQVSINSVNNGTVGSSDGAPDESKCIAANASWVKGTPSPEYQGVIPGITLNGNTKVLVASQGGLIPGQTYHIKLIITDVKDGGFDSAVFLEAGSFTTEPTDIFAGPDQTVCSDSAILNAISPLIGTWTVASGTGVFSDDKLPNSKVKGLTLGENKFVWTSTADGKTDTVKITYSNTPSSILYTPSTFSNASSTKISVSVTGSVTGSYTSTPAGLTINSSNGEITPNTSEPGTYTIEVNSSCGKISTTVTVNTSKCGTVGFDGYKNGSVYNLPTTFTCSDTTDYGMRADDQLKANEYIAPGFTIKYDQGVSFSNATVEVNENNTGFQNTFASKVVTFCVPTYEYQVRLTGVSGSGNVWIEDHATGAKYLVTPASSNMTITIPVGSIKGSSVFSGAGVSNVKINKVSTYLGSGYGVFNPSKAGAGKHTIYYTWDNGIGCSGIDSIVVNVTGVSTPPVIGKDTLVFCDIQNIKVDTLYSLFNPTMVWYDATLGGIALDKTADLVNGKTYYASQKSGACESGQRDSVLVIIQNAEKPTIANHLLSFCVVDYKKLSDIVIDGVGIKWYKQPVGGTELPITTLLDSITYYASQTVGTCESEARDSVVVKLRDSDKPTFKDPNIVQPLVFCSFPKPKVGDLKTYVLGNNLKFYLDSTQGKSISLNDTLKTAIYYISQKPEGRCESSQRLAISVSIGDTTTPNLNADTLTFCPSENPTVGNLLPSITSLTWYDVASGGTALASVTPLENGKIYYATQKAKTCESSSRDSLMVLFKSPEAPTGNTALSLCASKNPTAVDLVPVGLDIAWYDAPSGGNLLNSQVFLENGKTYYASKKSGTCESIDRLSVTVTLDDPKATLAASSGNAVCKGKQLTVEVANPVSGTIYNVYSSFNASSPVGVAPYTFTPANDTIYYIQAVSAGACAQSKPGTPILIRVNPLPKSPNVISSNLTVCLKSSLTLLATSGQPNVSYSWTGPNNFSSNLQNPVVSNSADSSYVGKYYVRVTDKNTGCVSAQSDSVTVKVISLKADFTPSQTYGFLPMKISFANQSANGLNFFWDFNDGKTTTETSPEHIFENDGVYKVYLVAYNGKCLDTAYSATIEVNRTSKLEIPNVFTPNNDNKNDVFNFKGDGLKTISAKMYNRWGQLVYEWDTLGGGWNGTTLAGINAPDGTYFYVIDAVGNDGVPYNYKGHVDLIR